MPGLTKQSRLLPGDIDNRLEGPEADTEAARRFRNPDAKKPGCNSRAFFVRERCTGQRATRSFDSEVPMFWNTETVWSADVTRKNLSLLLAQYCSTLEVASLPVFTCTV